MYDIYSTAFNQEISAKLVLDEKKQIMERYRILRKIAYSYWDIFTFTFGYILIFPIVQRLSYDHNSKRLYIYSNIISSIFFAYMFYKISIKNIIKTFNKNEYNDFVLFCKKYHLEEELLL
jgi:hypothetical protein